MEQNYLKHISNIRLIFKMQKELQVNKEKTKILMEKRYKYEQTIHGRGNSFSLTCNQENTN